MKVIMKRNSKLVLLIISLTLNTFIGVFPSQIAAYKYKKSDYWPDWDKWRECDPETQNMDSEIIENMYGFIDFYDINIQSMLIIRNGYIINEEFLNNSERMDQKSYYWPEADPWVDLREGRLHQAWSVTKSVVSLLTGIAIEMGLFDLDTEFFEVFPDKWDPAKYNDPVYGDAKRYITVENLLLQNVGINWVEGDPDPSQPGVPSWMEWALIYNFKLDYYLTSPLIYPPGYGHPYLFTYSSGNQEMLSVMIANRSGMTMGDFARKYLFKPLKIRNSEWDWWESASEWGTGDLAIKQSGGFGLFLTPRAMAHIGLMCLNEGKWRGRQVVSRDWISESTSVRITPGGYLYYGYLWWITPTELYPIKYYQAIGAFGQEIVVIPELDIVVVITSNEFVKTGLYGTPNNYIVEEYIFEAVLA